MYRVIDMFVELSNVISIEIFIIPLAGYQQTQNISIARGQRRPKVFDVGLSLYNVIHMFCVCLVGPFSTEVAILRMTHERMTAYEKQKRTVTSIITMHLI